jgi:hypothetical protein
LKLTVDIGDELSWLREELETAMERALSEVVSGGRPEYAAGFYSAVQTLADSLEGRYAAFIAEERERWRNKTAAAKKQ